MVKWVCVVALSLAVLPAVHGLMARPGCVAGMGLGGPASVCAVPRRARDGVSGAFMLHPSSATGHLMLRSECNRFSPELDGPRRLTARKPLGSLKASHLVGRICEEISRIKS